MLQRLAGLIVEVNAVALLRAFLDTIATAGAAAARVDRNERSAGRVEMAGPAEDADGDGCRDLGAHS